ncbi:hypothetical protein E2C01_066505 [Portunus trituberculatus]|uniref:Uncharacterized protein n=1 Tax=Portunus trituberculatus TaxID=210409 RepID=A0A5B7HSH7_PORTR|nr:hypothetical protein [Portunus trituberculatus]
MKTKHEYSRQSSAAAAAPSDSVTVLACPQVGIALPYTARRSTAVVPACLANTPEAIKCCRCFPEIYVCSGLGHFESFLWSLLKRHV